MIIRRLCYAALTCGCLSKHFGPFASFGVNQHQPRCKLVLGWHCVRMDHLMNAVVQTMPPVMDERDAAIVTYWSKTKVTTILRENASFSLSAKRLQWKVPLGFWLSDTARTPQWCAIGLQLYEAYDDL